MRDGEPIKLVKTKKKLLSEQVSISELIELVVDGVQDAGKEWTFFKPGIKLVRLKVARNYLDRLIAMAEKEEECNE